MVARNTTEVLDWNSAPFGSWSSCTLERLVAGKVPCCLPLLLEVMGPPLDQARKTVLRLTVVTGGAGEQDVVILVTLRGPFCGYSRLSNIHGVKSEIQGWFHPACHLLSPFPYVCGNTCGTRFLNSCGPGGKVGACRGFNPSSTAQGGEKSASWSLSLSPIELKSA